MDRPTCVICRGAGEPFKTMGEHRLFRCPDCTSLFYSPFLRQTGWGHAWESEKCYLERGANLLFYAEIAGLANGLYRAGPGTGNEPPAEVLEVGCSYGFLIDLGARLFSWRARGVDPDATAGRGGTDLGIEIVTAPVEEVPLDTRYDLVLAVQVVEHVVHPAAFVSRLAQLAGAGVVLLTTPDASIEDLGAEYHPGEHHVLFSRDGIARLLRAAGLKHIRFFPVSLPQMLCVAASRKPLPEPEPWPPVAPDGTRRDLETYLSTRLGDDLPPGLRLGLSFRLFELLVNAGRYTEAEAMLPALDRSLGFRADETAQESVERIAGAMLAAPSAETYLQAGPGCFAPYLFYRGILSLNHRADLRGAGRCFAQSARLYELEVGTFGLVQYRRLQEVAEEHARMVAVRSSGVRAALLRLFRGAGR